MTYFPSPAEGTLMCKRIDRPIPRVIGGPSRTGLLLQGQREAFVWLAIEISAD